MSQSSDNVVPLTTRAKRAAREFGAEHDRELLTILFTDLVDSTKLQQDAGNVEAARLTELHRQIVRDELARYDAREIEWAGDSCLAVFMKPSDAVVFALRMQAEHRRVRESEEKLPLVRVGIHLGEVVVKKRTDGGKKTEDLFGLQVSEAARVMSVARGGQIYCTRAVFDNAQRVLKGRTVDNVGDVVWVNYGAYLLKGSEDPVELCEIGSATVPVMKAPETNDKVAPVMPGGVEAMRALIPYEGVSQPVQKRLPLFVVATTALLFTAVGVFAASWLPNLDGPLQSTTSNESEAALAAQPKPVTRFSITSPVDIVSGPELSPDGSRLVFVGREDGTRMLYERRLDADDTEIRALEGTERATRPYFSPDGESIAFAKGRQLYSLRISTGVVRPLSDSEAAYERSGTWNDDGMIVQPARDSGLILVNSVTGEAEVLTDPRVSLTEYRHHAPQFLPDGDRVLFTAVSAGEDTATTEVFSITERKRQQLFTGGEFAEYVSTGHIVYALADGIWAVPFALDTLGLRGDPQQIFGPLNRSEEEGGAFSFSASGHLAYWPGNPDDDTDRLLTWIDVDGEESLAVPDTGAYMFPNLSPDGRKLAVTVGVRGNNRTWIFDLERNTSFPLNAIHSNNAMPTWSPQGDWIAYIGGGRDLYRIRPTPDAQPEVIVEGPGAYNPSSWSPDGSELIATFASGDDSPEIQGIDIETGAARTLVDTFHDDVQGRVSPNGEWLAYATAFSGRLEIWVQPYPDATPGTAVALTSDGGHDPVWSSDGTELFYMRSDDRSIGVINVPDTGNANWGLPRKRTDLPFVPVVAGIPVPAYDVAPDGRLVTVKQIEGSGDTSAESAREIRVVLNAFEEIKRLAPSEQGN